MVLAQNGSKRIQSAVEALQQMIHDLRLHDWPVVDIKAVRYFSRSGPNVTPKYWVFRSPTTVITVSEDGYVKKEPRIR